MFVIRKVASKQSTMSPHNNKALLVQAIVLVRGLWYNCFFNTSADVIKATLACLQVPQLPPLSVVHV